MTLICAYAPSDCKERISFFSDLEIFSNSFSEKSDNLILGGDLNTVDNPIDRISGFTDKCKNYFSSLKSNLNVIDTWHFYNENIKSFTYVHPTKSYCKSRIDYLLLNKELNKYVKDINIIPAPAPDYKCVKARLEIPQKTRGVGYWKLNVSILSEENYRNLISNLIDETIKNYSDHLTARYFLYFLKMRIKETTIKYCTFRNKTKKKCP